VTASVNLQWLSNPFDGDMDTFGPFRTKFLSM